MLLKINLLWNSIGCFSVIACNRILVLSFFRFLVESDPARGEVKKMAMAIAAVVMGLLFLVGYGEILWDVTHQN